MSVLPNWARALGVPVNVQATDGDHEDRTVVTWDTVLGATRYYMYRNTTNSTASATYQGYVTTNIFNDVSGILDQVYYYWVRPYNSGGYGSDSAPDTGFRGNGGVVSTWITTHFPDGYPGDLADSDGDGFDNLAEFISGTIPVDMTSFFKIEGTGVSAEKFVLNWNSASGRVYDVYWNESLTNTFQSVTNDLPFTQNSYTNTEHATDPKGFYQITVEME